MSPLDAPADGLPLPVRALVGAAAAGAAWWRFGAGPKDRRRPWAVGVTAAAAGALVVGAGGAARVIVFEARTWLPTALVGAAGCVLAARGTWRGRPLRRPRWLLGACVVLAFGPPLALLDRAAGPRELLDSLNRPIAPAAGWNRAEVVGPGFRGLLAGTAAAFVAVAAWPRTDDEPDFSALDAPPAAGAAPPAEAPRAKGPA